MIQIKVDQASLKRLNDRLSDYAAVTKQTASDCVKEQAQLLCEDMANLTPPILKGGGQGLTKAAETAGNKAVSGDIRKLFIAVGDRNINSQKAIVVLNLADATKTNNMAQFNRIIVESSVNVLRGLSPIMRKIMNDPDYTRAFAKAKNYLSRVPVQSNIYGVEIERDLRGKHNAIKAKFGGRIKKGQSIGAPRMLVESKQDLNNYIAERQLKVGRIKSGWLTALKRIPSPSINGKEKNFGADLRKAPAFIQRHNSSAGYCQVITDDKKFKLIIGNMYGDINGIATEADALNLALANREKQMALRIKTRLMANAAKSNAAAPKRRR